MTDFEAADGVPHTPSHQLISVSETQPVDVEVLMNQHLPSRHSEVFNPIGWQIGRRAVGRDNRGRMNGEELDGQR